MSQRSQLRSAQGLLAFLLFGSCDPSGQAFHRAQRLSTRGDWVQAVTYYERALEGDPENLEYRAALYRARLEASYLLLDEARKKHANGELADAVLDYESAVALNPANRYIREDLSNLRSSIRASASSPVPEESEPVPLVHPRRIDPDSRAPLRLRFAEGASLKTVLDTLGKLAGVNVIFDESFRDATVDFELDGVTFWEALDLLAQTNRFFYKVIDSRGVRVSPGTVR